MISGPREYGEEENWKKKDDSVPSLGLEVRHRNK